jgi:hypothetical protein
VSGGRRLLLASRAGVSSKAGSRGVRKHATAQRWPGPWRQRRPLAAPQAGAPLRRWPAQGSRRRTPRSPHSIGPARRNWGGSGGWDSADGAGQGGFRRCGCRAPIEVGQSRRGSKGRTRGSLSGAAPQNSDAGRSMHPQRRSRRGRARMPPACAAPGGSRQGGLRPLKRLAHVLQECFSPEVQQPDLRSRSLPLHSVPLSSVYSHLRAGGRCGPRHRAGRPHLVNLGRSHWKRRSCMQARA